MPDEHKTLEQRIADIEFNLKKLREEITNAYISWEGKIVLEQSPTQLPDQPKQTPDQPTEPLAQPKKAPALIRPGGGKPPGVWISQMTTCTQPGRLSRLYPNWRLSFSSKGGCRMKMGISDATQPPQVSENFAPSVTASCLHAN